MTIVEPIDQMQIAWSATAGTDRKLAGEMRVGARRKSRRLLVPGMNPLHVGALAQRVRHGIQTVADDTIDVANTRGMQAFNRKISGPIGCHDYTFAPARGAVLPATDTVKLQIDAAGKLATKFDRTATAAPRELSGNGSAKPRAGTKRTLS